MRRKYGAVDEFQSWREAGIHVRPCQGKDASVIEGELFDEKGVKAGSCKFTTCFKWVEYIPPTPSELLDKKTMMIIIIKSAKFLKDADLIGKQDPYIKFKYEDKSL